MSQYFKIVKWPLVVLALHVVLTFTGAYWHLGKLDNLMHFLGGASIAVAWLTFYLVLKNHKLLDIKPKWLQVLITVGITALVAIIWELMEFGLDYYFGLKMQPDVTDTISDLALGLLGSLVVATLKTRKR